MEPNLTVYQIAARYTILAIFVGVGAFITKYDGFVGILGYIFMAIGVLIFLTAILAMDPRKGENKEALENASEDFKDEWAQ